MRQNFPARGVDTQFTLNDSITIPSSDTGRLSEIVSWQAARMRAVLGETSWRSAVPISLKDLLAHQGRHIPGGPDALPTAAPSGGLGASNQVGTAASFARSDHQHLAFDSVNPAAPGAAAAPGTSNIAARRDHVHRRPTLDELGAASQAAVDIWSEGQIRMGQYISRFLNEWDAKDVTGGVGVVVSDAAAWTGQARQATVAAHNVGYLVSGASTRAMRFGKYVAGFRLRSSSNTSTSVVATLEVFMDNGNMLASVDLKGIDFTAGANVYQVFHIPFDLRSYPATGNGLLFRVHFKKVADITVDAISVYPAYIAKSTYNT